MALPLVIQQPQSRGVMSHRAGRREAKRKVLQGTVLSHGEGLGACLSQGGWRGVRSLQVPSPSPISLCAASRGFCN